jgi:hypothetical protein
VRQAGDLTYIAAADRWFRVDEAVPPLERNDPT